MLALPIINHFNFFKSGFVWEDKFFEEVIIMVKRYRRYEVIEIKQYETHHWIVKVIKYQIYSITIERETFGVYLAREYGSIN